MKKPVKLRFTSFLKCDGFQCSNSSVFHPICYMGVDAHGGPRFVVPDAGHYSLQRDAGFGKEANMGVSKNMRGKSFTVAQGTEKVIDIG